MGFVPPTEGSAGCRGPRQKICGPCAPRRAWSPPGAPRPPAPSTPPGPPAQAVGLAAKAAKPPSQAGGRGAGGGLPARRACTSLLHLFWRGPLACLSHPRQKTEASTPCPQYTPDAGTRQGRKGLDRTPLPGKRAGKEVEENLWAWERTFVLRKNGEKNGRAMGVH